MINVLIVDDHPIIRKGLKYIMSYSKDIVVKEEAGDSIEMLKKLRKDRFDVVLLDINMPGESGLEIIGQIKKSWPGTAVLILSAFSEEQYAVRALKAGASGYLMKMSAPEELISAVKKVYGGGRYVSSALAEKLAFMLDGEGSGLPHERLSEREFQVFLMIASGQAISEIAEELSLSVKTVSTHRTRILEKMGLKNNAEIIQYGVRNGLVE